ncbi:putative g2 mitotic-specific cyclin-b protein [Zalerion maritima]|uniref:G2 mitotic-specific cyclin-b protein n=1 Tax=Zalerion maritima TaxID=339359 RepID=A0AAD5WW41_9PEZI|nr:putative g2 mitotic-specific cyclin-b protein [Zalerion maritima]
MPPQGRTTRSRLVSDENDENSGTRMMTRAKAAALNVDELSLPAKPLQKKSAANGAHGGGQRKRAALGDVSNVTKVEASDGKKGGKTGLVSKATANRIQKNAHAAAAAAAARTTHTTKDTKKADTKSSRSGSGAGSMAAVPKRKAPSSTTTASVKEEASTDGEPLRKKLHTIDESENKQRSSAAISKPQPQQQAVPVEPEVFAYPPGVKDLDADDIDDPLMVAEYATDIFEYLRELEDTSLPNAAYICHQDDLEWKTRGILVDWLIEVHTRFHLLPETLFLAINIIDRFLSERVVQLDRLQLVGITAMFIASKYEEVLSPHVGNFRHVADDGFSEDEILSAERFILSTLGYDLSYPNPMNFLRRISKADNYDIQCRTVGKYLMEVSLLDHRFMAYRPSHVAAAAMYLARLILDRGEWDETLSYYAGYTEEEIEPVFLLMIDYLARPVVHEAFFKKYAGKKFLKASIMTRSWAKRNAQHFGITDTAKSLDDIC